VQVEALQPVHRAIVAIDIVGSAEYTDTARLQVRKTLYSMLATALRRTGVGVDTYRFEDRGDGLLALFDPVVPKNRLLVGLMQSLRTQLDDHNVGRADRVRLRVVVHAGEVIEDAYGISGSEITLAARLLDSSGLRAAVQLVDADLAVAVTEAIHRGVVESGTPGIDPSGYRLVTVEIGGSRVPMWVALSAGPPPPEPPPDASWWEPGDLHHRSIFIVDIEDSDSRSNDIKALHRAQIRQIVMGAITDTGITPDQYDRPADTGDGLRVLFAPGVPKNRLAGPLISALTRRLASYNATAPDGAHMRLRAVLSAGELRKDSYDYFGSPLNEAYWLLNSDELRTCLLETSAPMALMVSEDIYNGVVRHGYPQIDPGMFEMRVVKHKKRDARVWVSFPEPTD
jgi:class 3 adenylate cyclase